ncbi:hypothetical protein EV182_002968 [Spiromyces aspiralis]|uniref:Uncharacterized protein n=1 Tax=Spiromyces aspiralis TaxID=68401 RepID=A0ACC1HGV3_9FUNG|nr:hypothetical protein EV182_002968 [Spiromyces aspiralis]
MSYKFARLAISGQLRQYRLLSLLAPHNIVTNSFSTSSNSSAASSIIGTLAAGTAAVNTARLVVGNPTRSLLLRFFATANILTAQGAKNKEDSISGTVKPYCRHIIVCGTNDAQWPSKAEGISPLTMKLAAMARTLDTPTTVTLSDLQPGHPHYFDSSGAIIADAACGCRNPPRSAAPAIDTLSIVVYPDGFYAANLDEAKLDALIETLRNGKPKSAELSHHCQQVDPGHVSVFVCTHRSRDSRCGERGTKLLELLRREISQQGLGRKVSVWKTSHIGGHKYAANIIVYPRGDWYGGLEPTKENATRLLACLVENEVWWDKWRGAINLSKQEQKSLWQKHIMSTDGGDGGVDGDGCECLDGTCNAPVLPWQPAARSRGR